MLFFYFIFQAIKQLNGKNLRGHRIQVKPATGSKKQRHLRNRQRTGRRSYRKRKNSREPEFDHGFEPYFTPTNAVKFKFFPCFLQE